MNRNAFTLSELLVAMGASSIVLAALLLSTISLTKTFRATELYSRAQSAQIRIIDSVAMDLRRSVKVGVTTAPGSDPGAAANTYAKLSFGGLEEMSVIDGTFNAVTLQPNSATLPSTYLTLTIPAYYLSNDPAAATYRQLTTLISTGSSVRYGTVAGPVADITVQYRRQYDASYRSECVIRREAGVDRVIADQCDLIDLDIKAFEYNTFTINTWFIPTFSNLKTRSPARITSSDRVMLRNPRTD